MQKTRAVLDVLEFLQNRPEDECYGYLISQEIGVTTNGGYLVLDRLVKAGMVERFPEPHYDPASGRPRRVHYKLNREGATFLLDATEKKRKLSPWKPVATGADL